MTEAKAAPADPLIGTRIDGRYTIRSILGYGGMGVVYEGVHDELGRPVAIKVLNTAWASDRTAVERFLREARTASSFSHGNIVDVSDLGRLADGRPYLVMPRITGIDLSTLLGEIGPQPAKRVADLLAGVASALDLIHAKGYVHRDIKPENLMYIVREDGSETVMLLDFGIAKLIMSNEPRLTGQGAVFGTPHFMPPEAWGGALPDARGDVYALATVVFELITGKLPFDAENVMQVLTMKLSADAPSLTSVTGLAFPIELETVVATGLARNPDHRYGTASEFVTALKAATQHAPVSWRSGVLRSPLRSEQHLVERRRAVQDAPDEDAGYDAHDTVRNSHQSEPTVIVSDSEPPWPMPNPFGEGLRTSERNSYRYSARIEPRSHWLRNTLLVGGAVALVAVGVQRLVLEKPSAAPASAAAPAPGAQLAPTGSAAPGASAQAQIGVATAQPGQVAQQPAPAVTNPPTAADSVEAQPTTVDAPQPGAPNPQPNAAAAVPSTAAAQPAATSAAPSAPAIMPPTAAGLAAAQVRAPQAAAAASKPRAAEPPAARPARPAEHYEAPPEPGMTEREFIEPSAEPGEATGSPVLVVKHDATALPAETPARDPVRAKLLTHDATAALIRGEVGRAVELLRDATAADASQAAAWRTLGLALERAGSAPDAIDAYKQYLKLAPTGAQAEMVRERMQALDQ